MKLTRLIRPRQGERGFTVWLRPATMRRHYIGCCDCGLTHEFQFRIERDGKGRPYLLYRARRAARYTARERRRQRRS